SSAAWFDAARFPSRVSEMNRPSCASTNRSDANMPSLKNSAAALFLSLCGFLRVPTVALSQGESLTELHFPPRTHYKNPQAVLERYDEMTDVTKLRLGLASGNPLTLVLKPI